MKLPTHLVINGVLFGALASASAPSPAQTYVDPPGSAPASVTVRRFSDVDTNRDGLISREELARIDDERIDFTQIDADTSSTISRVEWNRLDLRFLEADTDRDGFISPSELSDLGDDTMTFVEIDVDRNSTISRVEWDAYNQLVKQDAEAEDGE